MPWQRCQFHLQQNAQAYVPRQNMKAEVAADIRAIFTAANWMESALPEGLTVFSFPAAHRQRLRTVNGLERLNQEIRRRTRMETSDEWEAGKHYLSLIS